MNVSGEHVNKTSPSTNTWQPRMLCCGTAKFKSYSLQTHTHTRPNNGTTYFGMCAFTFISLCWKQPINEEIKPESEIKVESIMVIFNLYHIILYEQET